MRRVRRPTGACDRVLIGNSRVPAFSAMVGEFGCRNFPVPAVLALAGTGVGRLLERRPAVVPEATGHGWSLRPRPDRQQPGASVLGYGGRVRLPELRGRAAPADADTYTARIQ
jgi:hypothetical protein